MLGADSRPFLDQDQGGDRYFPGFQLTNSLIFVYGDVTVVSESG